MNNYVYAQTKSDVNTKMPKDLEKLVQKEQKIKALKKSNLTKKSSSKKHKKSNQIPTNLA
jgi:hypothetical protein